MFSNFAENLLLKEEIKKNKQVAKFCSLNYKNKESVQLCALQKVWKILIL